MNEEMNRGMEIRRSVPFFGKGVESAKSFVQIRKHNDIRNRKCKGLKVNWYGNMLDDYNTVQFK